MNLILYSRNFKVWLHREVIGSQPLTTPIDHLALFSTTLSLQNLLCCAADVLEGKGIVQVAITVVELVKHQTATPPNTIKSPQRYQNLNSNAINNNGNSTDGFISKSSSSSSSQLSSTPSSPLVWIWSFVF